MATSVPVPMAIPTSACASAGASLIPSPTIATCLPAACSLRHLGHFFLRQHFREHAFDSHLPRDAFGGAAIVAGDHPDLDAHARSGARRRRLPASRCRRCRSRPPAGHPRDATAVLPSSASRSISGNSRTRQGAHGNTRPPTRASTPWPVTARKPADPPARCQRPRMLDDGPAQRMLGVTLGGGRQAQHFGLGLTRSAGRHP